MGGFENGTLRIFDIESLTIVDEFQYHRNQIEELQMSSNDDIIIVGDSSGLYSILSKKLNYQLVTYINECKSENSKIGCCFFDDLDLISLIGKNNNQISFFSIKSFDFKDSFYLTNSYAHSLVSNPFNKNELVILTCNHGIKIFKFHNGFWRIVKEKV